MVCCLFFLFVTLLALVLWTTEREKVERTLLPGAESRRVKSTLMSTGKIRGWSRKILPHGSILFFCIWSTTITKKKKKPVHLDMFLNLVASEKIAFISQLSLFILKLVCALTKNQFGYRIELLKDTWQEDSVSGGPLNSERMQNELERNEELQRESNIDLIFKVSCHPTKMRKTYYGHELVRSPIEQNESWRKNNLQAREKYQYSTSTISSKFPSIQTSEQN